MKSSGVRLAVVALGLAWATGGRAAEADWESPVGPDGVTRIIVEAEDMRGVNAKDFGGTAPEWRVGRAGFDHYQCNVFGGHWQSRTKTAMTDAGDNAAEIIADITIPTAGTYRVWAKYECPPFFNYAFDVFVRGSNGKELFRKTYGLVDSAKHFCFKKEPLSGSLYWPWGIDHDAAEGYAVALPAGRCQLAIAKARNPAPAGMRSVDVVMITDDPSEISAPRYPRYPLLDELRRANHLYMRVRLSKDAQSAAEFTWNRAGKRYPDFHGSSAYMPLVRMYEADGTRFIPPVPTNAVAPGKKSKPSKVKPGQIPTPLKPGEASVWLDIGPLLNVESANTFFCKGVPVDERGAAITNQPPPVLFAVDFAFAPDEKRIVKTFERRPSESGDTVAVLLQPDLGTEEGYRWTMTVADAYRHVIAELDRTPRASPMPKRMRFFSHTSSPLPSGATGADWAWDLGMDFRRAIGLNTVNGRATGLGPEEYARQDAWARKRGFELMKSATWQHSQDPDKVADKIEALGTADRFHFLSYGDEIGLPPINETNAAVIAAFHDFLNAREVRPSDLGLKNWESVKPLKSLSPAVAVQIGVVPEGTESGAVDRTLKRLYWYSTLFRISRGVSDFAAKTVRLRERLGPQVNTSANLGGMHPFYWMHQSSFIDAFKYNAMTLAWTEDYDYTQPETSRLVVEYQVGYLKAGTKYNGQRMMMYCMPHYPGQSPEHLLQNAILEIGQGVKDIDWFSTPPDGFTTENYVNVRNGVPTFRVMREVSEIAGAVENWLEPAKPVDAPVAMLLSEASDLWEICGLSQNAVQPDSEPTNVFQEERKNTYYALRNAGYRVDLVTEADVRDGYLQRYRALYVGGENMERATAKAVADWVKGGGVLYASAGAARKDEYDEPLPALSAPLGRGAQTSYMRCRGPVRSKLELLFLKPLDTVTLEGGGSFEAVGTVEKFGGGEDVAVLGRFADGSPAFVSRKHGAGRAYYIGAMPGEAWAKKALPVMPCGKGGPENRTRYPQFEPVAFDAPAASAILRPLKDAGIAPDLRADQPNVVCNRLAGPKGSVITVVNLGHGQKGPVQNLSVSIDGIASARKVWSYYQPKGLAHELKDGTLTIQLPEVKLADVVVVEQ